MIDSLYDVAIIGGGPAGLSIGAELSRMGHEVLVIEKGNIGETDRSWIVPGSVIAKLDPEVQKFAYNGVTRFLEYTPGLEIKWDAVAPWESGPEWKRYPFIKQEGILKYWAEIIRQNNSKVIDKCAYLDYHIIDDTVTVRTIRLQGDSVSTDYKARLLIDASGFDSEIAKTNRVSRQDYFWWSVYGYELSFSDVGELKHPGNLGDMQVGDYMLWQSFQDIPLNSATTLSQLRPIMEYEVLDEKTVFVFILYFCENKIEKDFMKNQLDYILQNEASIKSFRQGELSKERFGWYPSNGLSQKNARDRVAFVGDSGCWTIPAGWGMSFILNNYQLYAENISEALKCNKLDQKTLNDAATFQIKEKYEIVMDKLVLHFLAFAIPEQIDKFTKIVMDNFGGERLEIMFCLQMTEQESIETLKVLLKEFHLTELAAVWKNESDYHLFLEVAEEFVETAVVDAVREMFGKNAEEGGFEFLKELVQGDK